MLHSCFSHWPLWLEWTELTVWCEAQKRHPICGSFRFWAHMNHQLLCGSRQCWLSLLLLFPASGAHGSPASWLHNKALQFWLLDMPTALQLLSASQSTRTMGVEHDTMLGFGKLDRKEGCEESDSMGLQLCQPPPGTINNGPNWRSAETHTSKETFRGGGEEINQMVTRLRYKTFWVEISHKFPKVKVPLSLWVMLCEIYKHTVVLQKVYLYDTYVIDVLAIF